MKGNDSMTKVRTNGNGVITIAVSAVFLIALVGGARPGQAAAATANTFSGRAFAVQATTLGITVGPLEDTGSVSSDGGALEASLLSYPLTEVPDVSNGALRADVLHAAVVAGGNASRAEAAVATLMVKTLGQSIGVDFLTARASATCANGIASASGSSEIVSLTLNGQAITVAEQPNTIVPVDGLGTIIVNEQIPSASAGANKGGMTVNALHIKLADPVTKNATDVTVSSAHADIACAGNPPPPPSPCPNQDFVTGGGWITSPSDSQSKANFAVAGGTRAGWGHLQYIDHSTGMKVKGTSVTKYEQVTNAPTSRRIEGTVDIDGKPGTYVAQVADRGEPGYGHDTFILTLSGSDGFKYKAGGDVLSVANLNGGNIQLHCK